MVNNKTTDFLINFESEIDYKTPSCKNFRRMMYEGFLTFEAILKQFGSRIADLNQLEKEAL